MLANAFSGLTFVDTSIFIKTMKRQRAYLRMNDTIGWESNPTRKGASLDGLFETNLRIVEARIDSLVAQPPDKVRLAG